MTHKINLFSEKNYKSEYLAADLSRLDNADNIYFDTLESAAGTGGEASIYLIKEDERENLKDALRLIELCSGNTDGAFKIYVFSSSDVARAVLDSVKCENAEIILIDPIETAIWGLMEDHSLFYARDRLQDEELRIAIIGKGRAIPSIIRTVCWCGRMRLYRMQLSMIGNDMAAVETELKLRSPGLFTQTMKENTAMKERGLISQELNLPLRLTRKHYYQADTDTEELEIALDNCLDANYIIIDEGDDEETLRTAMAVRAHFMRKHVLDENYLAGGRVRTVRLPDICVFIRDEAISRAAGLLTVEGHEPEPGRDELAFVPFGSHKDVYSVKRMIDPDYKRLAYELFPDEFARGKDGVQGEELCISHKRMLYASALHLRYKLRDMNLVIKGENDAIYNTDNFPEMHDVSENQIRKIEKDLNFEMAALEHQCWCVFKLCDGWIPADAYHAIGYGRLLEDGRREHRLFAAKMNAACVESSALSGTGTKLYGNPSYFTDYNRQTALKTYDALKKVYPDIRLAMLFKPEED